MVGAVLEFNAMATNRMKGEENVKNYSKICEK